MARILIDVPYSDENIYNAASQQQSKTTAKNMERGWLNLFHLSSLKSTDIGEKNGSNIKFNNGVVEKFIALCMDKGFRAVIVCSPLGKELNDLVSKEFEQTTTGGIVEMAQRMKVPFFNYREDERFQNFPSLYIDGCYRLGYKGSMKYMKILLSDIAHFYDIDINNKFLTSNE